MIYKNHNLNIKKYVEIIEKCFFIVDKSRQKRPFTLNYTQRTLTNQLKQRNLVLKARKEGVSSIILALWLIAVLTEKNVNAVIISHEKGSTQRLLGRAKYYLEHMKPYSPELDRASVNELYYKENNSRLYIGTAGAKAFGHGDDVSHLHISELPWWENQEVVHGLLEACIDDHIVVAESTANGVGELFHILWGKAKEGKVGWNPIFFGWQDDPGYTLKYTGTEDEFNLNSEEKILKQNYKLSIDQLNWRRYKKREMIDPSIFPQEYPINDLEAFLVTGRKVFDSIKLQNMYSMRSNPQAVGEIIENKNGEIVFSPSPTGILKIYKRPESNRKYALGADVCGGSDYSVPEGDKRKLAYSAAVVKDRETWESVAVVNCRLDEGAWADYLNLLGRYYNKAILAPEENNMGIAVIRRLIDKCKYPNLYMRKTIDEITRKLTKKVGWRTDMKSKPHMVEELKRAIRENLMKINDDTTIKQLLNYAYDKHNKPKPQGGEFSDLVIAEGISLMICQEEPVSSNKKPEVKDTRERSPHVSGY